jgi:hypothetical protein
MPLKKNLLIVAGHFDRCIGPTGYPPMQQDFAETGAVDPAPLNMHSRPPQSLTTTNPDQHYSLQQSPTDSTSNNLKEEKYN